MGIIVQRHSGVLNVLSDVGSEHEVDIEDSLSWVESDPDSEKVSDSYSETC